MWTQPYGMGLEEIKTSDYILVNDELEVLQGTGIPNPANNFHLHVYKVRPDVRSIVHTHPPYVMALSLLGVPLAVQHMDVMCFYDDCAFLPDWPGVPFGDEEGELLSAAIGDRRAALLAHHGMLTVGKSVEEATYLATFMESAARMQMRAMSAGTIQQVKPSLGKEAHDWRLSDGPVNAHYAYWARRAIRAGPDVLT